MIEPSAYRNSRADPVAQNVLHASLRAGSIPKSAKKQPPVRRAPVISQDIRAAVSGSRGDELTAAMVKRIAPGIRPEIVDQLYDRGVRVRYGPTGGGWYDPTTRTITLGNEASQNREVPSNVNPIGVSGTTFGRRGVLEHEIRHAFQHVGNVPLSAVTNLEYMRGRIAMQSDEVSSTLYRTSPFLNLFGAITSGIGRAADPPVNGLRLRAEAFANYGEGAYANLSRAPYMNIYPNVQTNIQSVRSIGAQTERLNAAARSYGAYADYAQNVPYAFLTTAQRRMSSPQQQQFPSLSNMLRFGQVLSDPWREFERQTGRFAAG